jgi:hypothetical protein
MSTDKVIVIIAVAIVGALVCALQVRRALRDRLERDEIVAAAWYRTERLIGTTPVADDEWVYDGPDSLRLLADLDAHLDNYVAEHPDVAAGFERLRRAVRDEQQRGGDSA